MSDRILPLQPDRDPLAYATSQELSVDMQVCRRFIIQHGLGGTYAPDTLAAPNTLTLDGLPPAPTEAPTISDPGYLRLVCAIGSQLTLEERKSIRERAEPYRIEHQTKNTSSDSVPDRLRRDLPVELARRMFLVEQELNNQIKQLKNV